MRKQRIPTLIASALGLIASCIAVIEAWDIFTEARSQTPAPQEQMSPVELSAAIDAQRQASANLCTIFNIRARRTIAYTTYKIEGASGESVSASDQAARPGLANRAVFPTIDVVVKTIPFRF